MALELRTGRGGEVRPYWYGRYIRQNGTKATVNLNVKVEGKPPVSGLLSDTGDAAFERSRERAVAALTVMREEERRGRLTTAVAFRQFRERTGAALNPNSTK